MHVSAVPGFVPAPHAFARPEKAEKTENLDKPLEGVDALEVDENESREATTESKPGVLRLLEEGHFKGVAELRHRIRFNDELAAKAEEETATVLSEGADDLIDSVTEGIKHLDSSLRELDEAAATDGIALEGADTVTVSSVLSDFEEAVALALNGDESDGLELEAVAVDLQAAFDSLITSLETMYAAPVEEEPVVVDSNTDVTQTQETPSRELFEVNMSLTNDDDSLTTPDTVDETETSFSSTLLDDAIASLTASFEEALAALMAEAEETLSLDDPAPAPGNGVAFDKFLAIYNSMRNVETSTVDQTV